MHRRNGGPQGARDSPGSPREPSCWTQGPGPSPTHGRHTPLALSAPSTRTGSSPLPAPPRLRLGHSKLRSLRDLQSRPQGPAPHPCRPLARLLSAQWARAWLGFLQASLRASSSGPVGSRPQPRCDSPVAEAPASQSRPLPGGPQARCPVLTHRDCGGMRCQRGGACQAPRSRVSPPDRGPLSQAGAWGPRSTRGA